MRKFTYAIWLAVLFTVPAQAGWVLDGEASTVSFVSTKAINVAEVHKFAELKGAVDGDGQVNVTISLASVDTGIELRDNRMREMLFETEKFGTATVSAKVDADEIDALKPGQAMHTTIEGILTLHGETRPLPMDILIARSGDDQLLVTSEKPVVVNAPEFGLVAGVERLREVAGLPSISTAVPVSFVLAFFED